jgi:hypothetical protein
MSTNAVERDGSWVDAIARGRDALGTEEAAFVLRRKPQTLRSWAQLGHMAPVRSIKRGRQREWLVTDIKRFLGVV